MKEVPKGNDDGTSEVGAQCAVATCRVEETRNIDGTDGLGQGHRHCVQSSESELVSQGQNPEQGSAESS